jgi:hypothetical protein
MNRRIFLVGCVTCGVAEAAPPVRFRVALERVMREEKHGHLVSKLDHVVDGRTVEYNLRQELDIPWWKNIYLWLKANWKQVLQVLLSLVIFI